MEGQVIEEKVEFKAISDRRIWGVRSSETNEQMVTISGYDLDIDFNMQYLKSIEDVEACLSGLSEVFRKLLMARLLPSQTP